MKKILDKISEDELLELALITIAAQLSLSVMLMLRLFKAQVYGPLFILTILAVFNLLLYQYLKKRLP